MAINMVRDMTRHVRMCELSIGVEGLALLRQLYEGTDEVASQRLAEVRLLLADDTPPEGDAIYEKSAREGYRAWSESYDEPGNPIIALEQPAAWALVDPLAPGTVLDAACGTGRHARHLVELGHEVLGVDLTPEMLERAERAVPQANFLAGDLCAIPAADASFDLAVCGLALSHLADLRPGIEELARVLKPGGHLVVSVLHPFLAQLGWHAPFADADGQRGFVREHTHTHADYLAAFRAADLDVLDCAEPRLEADHVRAKRRVFERLPEATMQAYAGLPGVLVWFAEKAQAATVDR
jgi:SAM-dependent methyltransferase